MQGINVTSITQAKCILRAITGNLDVIGGDMLFGPCEKAKLTCRIPPRMIECQQGWWFPEEIGEDPVLFGVFESNVKVLTPDTEAFCDPATGAVTFGPLLCRIYPLRRFV